MKLISISLSPNVFLQDIEAAKMMRSLPLNWIKGGDIGEFEQALGGFFDLGNLTPKILYTFNSGRSALFTLLKAFDIGAGSEVLLQAFTCNAVPNPVLWLGAKPIYVDVNKDTYNMNEEDLKQKVTKKSKLIIVQHTFGLAADMESILRIARKYKLFVIEDCAHALGATYRGQKVGTFGDAAFFSFGRDKVISSVYGGAATISARCTFERSESAAKAESQSSKLEKIYHELSYPSAQWIGQQLRHPIVIDNLLRWYNVPVNNYGIGKVMLQFSQASHYVSKAVHWREKQGLKPDYFPRRMPNALAYLALKQFKRLEQFNQHRKELANFYYQELKKLEIRNLKLEIPRRGCIYLRYPVRHPKAKEIIRKARMNGILLGDWYNFPVAPDDTNLEKMHYKEGSCPVAEKLSREVFNLPTNPNLSMEDATRVVEFLKATRL